MKKWKKIIALCLTGSMLTGSCTAFAETGQPETEVSEDAGEELKLVIEGQLSPYEIGLLNDGNETIYTHNDRVTFVDGTCTDGTVTNMEEAAAVVDSMMDMIGADENTQFVPWREVTDPMGNYYYIFQQMYKDTTVLGGAIKVITDAEGNMIGLSSSVESEMPEVNIESGITAEEAEKIVFDREYTNSGTGLEILGQFTAKVILPVSLVYSLEDEKNPTRFVWVVYTNNPESAQQHSDLPYLAHYVDMSGEYLYNLPAIAPADEAGQSGYEASYIFEFMEPVDYTGYVDLSDGTEKEITVTLMRDKRTGMYYLGNIERKIAVAECYDFLYDNGRVIMTSSTDNQEWDQVGLLSLYNYCRAYDYYKEIGWIGGDGEGTPILILNNFCDDHKNEVNNACYVGKVYGTQVFLASKINDYSQCLDVIAHEFTHCVTGSLMTYNSYMNDYGAINEAMSDIQGKNCEQMAGDADADNWILGSNSATPVRSMDDPHRFGQPEFSWDLYYKEKVKTPSAVNDHGGVHTNSSLLNQISYMMVSEGGMSLEEARTFWFMVDCAMVPQTDYLQLSELLPWVLEKAGLEKYSETLDKAMEAVRLGQDSMPETFGDDRALVTLHLPETETFDQHNWVLTLTSINLDMLIQLATNIFTGIASNDYSILPETLQNELLKFTEEEEEKASEEKSEGFLDTLLGLLGEEEKTEEEIAKEKEHEAKENAIKKELTGWLQEQIREAVFTSNTSAGPDGTTVNTVARPGRAFPILMHATVPEGSQTPDQLVYAICINGKWYDMAMGNMENMLEETETSEEIENAATDFREEMIEDIFGKDMEKLSEIKSLDDILNMFTVEIKGGENLELSSEGLEEITIPEPTPFEEKPFGTIEPGKKSRPKKAEATVDVTETEELDDAA